jgi:xanthine dehydrogenase accessory factor
MNDTTADELDTLFKHALDWHHAGHKVAIATVIETWGSAPRRVGAHLVIRDDGHFEGSVSGGCVEGAVVTQAIALAQNSGFERMDFGVADETAWEVGLACGGRISVLIQTVDEAMLPPELIEKIVSSRKNGVLITIETNLSNGASIEISNTAQDSPIDIFRNSYVPPQRLAIIGAVHIAQSLVNFSRLIGIAATVIDPRQLFASDDRFSGIILNRQWPDEALSHWAPNAASAVVVLSHDPKLDDPGLIAALHSPAYYIAALGSRKSHAARLERLGKAGFDDQTLARIHGPAGLDIGAANPAEIALSITAQMTAAWRRKL